MEQWELFRSLKEGEVFGEQLYNYLQFFCLVVGTLMIKRPLARLLARIGSRIGITLAYESYKVTVAELVLKPMEHLLQTILFYLAVNKLGHLLEGIQVSLYIFGGRHIKNTFTLADIADHLFLFLFILFLGQVVSRFVDLFYYLGMDKAEAEKNRSRVQMLPLLREISKLIVWALCVFWELGAVFHVNVPALITGLGIGGVAIALAGKETVENFFAAFTLLSDKPFVAGEIIKIGDFEGVVDRIGFRSTRLRNMDGATIVMPNQTLVSQTLMNLTSGNSRGMKTTVSIVYGLKHETLVQIINEIEQKIADTPPVRRPVTVVLDAMDKDAFQITVSYRIPHPISEDYQLPAIKNAINLHIFEVVNKYTRPGIPPAGLPAANTSEN